MSIRVFGTPRQPLILNIAGRMKLPRGGMFLRFLVVDQGKPGYSANTRIVCCLVANCHISEREREEKKRRSVGVCVTYELFNVN